MRAHDNTISVNIRGADTGKTVKSQGHTKVRESDMEGWTAGESVFCLSFISV